MVVDLTLIQPSHLVTFGVSFALVFSSIWWGLRHPKLLRPHPRFRQVYLAGFILVAAVVLLTLWQVSQVTLQWGLLIAACLILIVGTVDEHTPLSPRTQLIWQLIIAVVIVLGGWNISYVSHPWQDSVISLAWWHWSTFLFPGSLLAVIWYVFLMNSLNWLDGVDGLASGVGLVACLMLAAVSLLPSIYDSRTLTLSLVGAGSLLAFWLWNWPPARIFLGTSGSWFLGLYLGMIATVSGGKVVTTLLILALPVIDVALVIGQRLWLGQPLWQGDTKRHLHHRLLAAGYSSRTITVMAMLVTAGLGVTALLLQTQQKMWALLAVAVVLVAVAVVTVKQSSKASL